MQLLGEPRIALRSDAQDFVNLYASLGERAENFLPDRILDNLNHFVRLCYEEPDDPARQKTEINRYILELQEAIPGYVDVSLMLFPTEDSKAFVYNGRKLEFTRRVNTLLETEAVDATRKKQLQNILRFHDFSVGTPPVTEQQLKLMYQLFVGTDIEELRSFRDVIGINDDSQEAQWTYLMGILDQMVIQSSHYTTPPEKDDFLNRIQSTINFKGLNGFIRTVVSGTAQTAIKLISEEVFREGAVKVIDYQTPDQLYNCVKEDLTKVYIVKIDHLRNNIFNQQRWLPALSRMIFVDDSPESRASNTSLVFAFHNKIINTLNKFHTKKLGALANPQLNLRLILEKINRKNLEYFRDCAEKKIEAYNKELQLAKTEQLGRTDSPERDLVLYKFDDFVKQILKDRYILTKFRNFLTLVLDISDNKTRKERHKALIREFEERMVKYFYSNKKEVQIVTVMEGGGRNQIRTYGEYLLRRPRKSIEETIKKRCKIILDVLPDNYERTLHNHFHKNFGINLFLEKYKQYLTKTENDADRKGRFKNFLIDLGIYEKFNKKTDEERAIITEFISGLGSLNITSISDDVQMIIRDLIFSNETRPFILHNKDSSWEYKDLFPWDRFDINAFDLDIELNDEGRIDYERLQHKLTRMKSSLQLFDETGTLWDAYCDNLTIIINDPSNPLGYTDFNNPTLIRFLKFISSTKITLFLDEAYNDAVKIEDRDEPKFRTISRYIMNNISSFPRVSVVASISTTKNLGATGNRLGAIVATLPKEDLIQYARKQNDVDHVNANSLYMLVNTLEAAQLAKKVKDAMESELPKNASRYKIKEWLSQLVIETTQKINEYRPSSIFEGSPLHLFLLNELAALDKLDVLQMPDDFKYKGEAFFSYYQNHLLGQLNGFRINRIFRSETIKRLKLAKKVAENVIENNDCSTAHVIDSDGSYLFNLMLKDYFSYQDLEKFTLKLASERGIAILPYETGGVRFALGNYIEGSEESYRTFATELENALKIFLDYWKQFADRKNASSSKEERSEDILDQLFTTGGDKAFIQKVLADYDLSVNLKKKTFNTLSISNIITLYHAFPERSGLSINSIDDSQNAVFEFYESIGQCRNVREFIKSQAFTKIYENLLPQIYKRIPLIKNLHYSDVIARYGKTTLLKYVDSKLTFQPDSYILDQPDEKNIMREILIELENILFSDAKMKILALNASNGQEINDWARLEGVNRILRKYIQEILLHFNLPFEQEALEPSLGELMKTCLEQFGELVGKTPEALNLREAIQDLALNVSHNKAFSDLKVLERERLFGYLQAALDKKVLNADIDTQEKISRFYLLTYENAFQKAVIEKVLNFDSKAAESDDQEILMVAEKLMAGTLVLELDCLLEDLFLRRRLKLTASQLREASRHAALFVISLMNRSKSTEYYDRYIHPLMRLTEITFKQQNSSFNEMIQHGITLYRDFEVKTPVLKNYKNGELSWIHDIMVKCGVIASEQAVQEHTRIATDAKKREYPFHKINRTENGMLLSDKDGDPHAYIKNLSTKPSSDFFTKRLADYVSKMDAGDYRCKILTNGLIKVMFVIQKSYMKYLTDLSRLLEYENITLETAQNFVPDVILFLGAPEKVISFPHVGYFDIDGPNGKIKTLLTPLKKKADYFGNVKKPWLTMINEKVKEMGGMPIHGSLFAVEEEDGSLFVVWVSGDSGVGKSEMLAAMQLKWMKHDLQGIRAIKLIAGDMFHVFPDKDGNLYGIGTEVGDFSRVTDFDPEYIKKYKTLFESSADSNVDDLNSRSTISGLCDIGMPFKIDIILTAYNYAREEAGIIRYDNPENFLLYRDSHGERKEKATSQDGPNLQRTLLRYTGDKNIVDLVDKHGNYLDTVLDWVKDDFTGKFYLASSYKMIDKIDIEAIVNQIFVGKTFTENGQKYHIREVKFDIIKNRFVAHTETDEQQEAQQAIDRTIFGQLFNSLASTPAGQPFIAEDGQVDQRRLLVDVLKGNKGLKGKNIRFGILSTDLGKKGKEITGPQKAAQELLKLIQEVKIMNPDINQSKKYVKERVRECYAKLFDPHTYSMDVDRYNFQLYQVEKMRKAQFVRLDNRKKTVDLSNIRGFHPVEPDHEFSPLLLTPYIDMELSGFTETCEQLMSQPNISEFANDLFADCADTYIADGYESETIINNIVIQLLLMNGYIALYDLTRGRITEKVNRETLAAAKHAATRKYQEVIQKTEKQTPKSKKPNDKLSENQTGTNGKSNTKDDKKDNKGDEK